jgi:hypothetical protein
MLRVITFFATCAFATSLQAQTVYKCTSGGKTAYGDRPCEQGASRALPPPPAGISPADMMGPQGGDARTLLEADKLRFARDKELARTRTERTRTEAREERERARGARSAQARRQKCDKLRLRHKWAEEDLAHTVHGPAHETARTKLRRQAETLAVECPA